MSSYILFPKIIYKHKKMPSLLTLAFSIYSYFEHRHSDIFQSYFKVICDFFIE